MRHIAALLAVLMVLAAASAAAEVLDPATTTCPEGTIMVMRFSHFEKGDNGELVAAVDIKCRRILPKFPTPPKPEVYQ